MIFPTYSFLFLAASPPVTMASYFGSASIISYPVLKTHPISSSSQLPNPTPTPPPQPPLLSTSSSEEQQQQHQQKPLKPITKADSTDWIASSLTRRFGLGAGLAWAGFLAFGVISEQVKTRFEVSQQEANSREVQKEEEVLLPNGIRYYDIKVGGGDSPRKGDLVVIDLKGKVEGSEQVFVDTFGKDNRPFALLMGSRPYTMGMCEGIELVLRSMKAGGKRRVIIPPSLGFGEKGTDLGSGMQIPPSATLEYIIQVDKVSIAPA